MKIDLIDLQRSALANFGKAFPQASGVLYTAPVYSKLRLVADLHPATSVPVFASATFASEQHGDLRAFDYAKGEVASAGGFGTSTTATQRHTNVTKKGEVPNGGVAFVNGFRIKADPLKKPASTPTTAAGAASDADNTSTECSDNRSGHKLLLAILHHAANVYLPYVQIEDGPREYLGKLEFSIDGGSGLPECVLAYPEGWSIPKGVKFVFGLERKHDFRNIAYVNDYTGTFFDSACGLDLVLDGAIPTDGELIGLVDLTVEALGVRTVVRGS